MPGTVEPFICGGIASCFSEIVTFPIDLVKTRLQIQGQADSIKTSKPKYTGMFNCFKMVVKEEGPRALYAGYIYFRILLGYNYWSSLCFLF